MGSGHINKAKVTLTYVDDKSLVSLVNLMEQSILTNIGGRVTKLVRRVANEQLEEIKKDLPWENRTGHAQEGLTVEVLHEYKNTWSILVYYDPDIVKAWRPTAPSSNDDGWYRYGYSLEFLFSRRYKVLTEITQHIFVECMNQLDRLLKSPRRRDK